MLRSEFRFRNSTWPVRLVTFLLGEAFLGFCAIIATALTLFPILFDVSPATSHALETCQWIIIGLFGAEYVLALFFAPDRKSFLLNPWRLLDLATIAIPLATILPSISNTLRSSPILRLVRLIRVVTMGVRASGAVVREGVRQSTAKIATGPTQVRLLRGSKGSLNAEVSWQEFLHWVRAPGAEWYHVSSPSPTDLAQIAATAGISESLLKTHLLGTGYPHIETLGRYAGLFVWLPEQTASGKIERHGVFLLIGADNLLSFSTQPTKLLEATDGKAIDPAYAALPFAGRMTCQLLRTVLAQSEKLSGYFEQELHALEDVPVRDSREEFFERTFRLKKELAAAQSDLWRLKSLLGELADQRTKIPCSGEASATEEFRRLASDADFLYETIINIREEVLSLIDLHLNIVSFDMNRVMRVLAVVSVLGLIPSVIGGLFGMNLADNPWPFTLPQVAFSVCLGMIVALYLFFIKGWLR
jgi:Mg2+ and Co2+ transporter CorA